MKLGACHVETPYIELGQLSTALYFSYFVLIVPAISLIENTLLELSFKNNSELKGSEVK
jgi:ubiquinol-cytochrome c reductase cytochrome b subunit